MPRPEIQEALDRLVARLTAAGLTFPAPNRVFHPATGKSAPWDLEVASDLMAFHGVETGEGLVDMIIKDLSSPEDLPPASLDEVFPTPC